MNNYTDEQKQDYQSRVDKVNQFLKDNQLSASAFSYKIIIGKTDDQFPIWGDIIKVVFEDLKYANNTTDKEPVESQQNGDTGSETNNPKTEGEVSNG